MENTRIHALTMPKWGLSMREGKIAAWLVHQGAEVGPGIEVVDIETEKIASGLEPEVSGILRRRIARPDETISVGGLVAVIAEPDVPEEEIDRFIANFQTCFVPAAAMEKAAGPVPQTLQVNGITLRYLVRGEGGEVGLLLHGFGGDINSWLFNHEALASDRAVYALDLPGHGGSSQVREFLGFSDFAEVVAIFLDKLGLKCVHIASHSMGGAVALRLAEAQPERVASLSLISSAALGREIDAEYITGFISASRRKDIKPILDKLFANHSLVSRQLVDDVLKYKRLDGVVSNLRMIADRSFPGGCQTEVLRDVLLRVRVPVMVIWGSEDRIIPAAHAQELPESVVTQLVPGAGHMVQMEAASKVNRLIQSFWQAQG
jgi:pyruvate dehydrogenase E2 component (dihydrolipoamide acetyltransferase)